MALVLLVPASAGIVAMLLASEPVLRAIKFAGAILIDLGVRVAMDGR